MSTNDPRQSTLPSYRCPHLQPCLTREVIRIALSAILAWTIGSAVGCNGSLVWRGLGVSLKANWFDDPPPATQPGTPLDTPSTPAVPSTRPT